MTGTALLIYGALLSVAILSGGIAGGFVAWKCWKSSPPWPVPQPVTVESDNDVADTREFEEAAIDMAATEYAETHNLTPQGAALVAARLKTLAAIGRGKGWF